MIKTLKHSCQTIDQYKLYVIRAQEQDLEMSAFEELVLKSAEISDKTAQKKWLSWERTLEETKA